MLKHASSDRPPFSLHQPIKRQFEHPALLSLSWLLLLTEARRLNQAYLVSRAYPLLRCFQQLFEISARMCPVTSNMRLVDTTL